MVVIEDIVPARPLSSQNGEFSQTILSELLDDWRNNHRGTQIVGWFRTISTPPRQLRLNEEDSTIHQSYFTQPYQVALAFSQQSTDVYVGFFKSSQGTLDVERIYPFIELSDSPSPTGLAIRNLAVTESSQQAADLSGGGRRVSQSNHLALPLILRLGLPLLILLAVLTPLLIHFDVIETGSAPADSANLIELVIPSADDQGMSLIGPNQLTGPAEGIRSITFMNRVLNEDKEDSTVWIERLADSPLDTDPPGGFIDYAYYSIASKGMDERSAIEFAFEVPEHWKELKDIGMHTIRAYKSSDEGWIELTNIGEVRFEEGKYIFNVNSNGFSYFALGGTKATQRVVVEVKIPEHYQQIIENVELAKGNENCDRLPRSPGVFSFECDLGIEILLSPSSGRGSFGFTKWSVDNREYPLNENIRITSIMVIAPVIKAQPAPTSTLAPTPQPEPSETPEPSSPPSVFQTLEPTSPPDPSETPEPTSAPDPSETPEPTVIPGTLSEPMVRVSYRINPPDGGEITVYQDSEATIPCHQDNEPPNGYFGFLCLQDSEILLSAIPSTEFKLDEIIIETGNAERIDETGGLSRAYRLETTDITISVSFTKVEQPGS